ncbi:adenylate/guanylate cyclase domain-containing protein [Acaryochloris sp. IP29b_bin.148]|uniref:adenylate/guanylate cyclase domain-containing protein n=1 Tax=Acaryochloris sp. IP29b_bin.148 TaxID=2969218 RepID=UPI0026092AEA|nr:adenylate/guanylate cyclase domain-containing protein [Acaryochloris sp. IP29b_bin.148]
MLKKLSIQSKLTLMLLGVSVSSILVIALIGYNRGKAALTRRIFHQLTSLRTTKSYEVRSFFNQLNRQVRFVSDDPTTKEAMQAFKQAHKALNSQKIPSQWQQAIQTYYQQEFIRPLAANIEGEPQVQTYLPLANSGSYLQYHYTIKTPDFDQKVKIDDPGDGSNYTQVHRQYHPAFRSLVSEFAYEDLFLIDPETEKVIYSAYKGVDFGTDLASGPYSQSVLAQAFRKVIQEGEPNFVTFTDFEPYRPSHNQPAAIVASPLFEGGTLIGVMALQINISDIDQVMTNGQRWQEMGLGKSGETYLVGADSLLRSNSRFLLENSPDYFRTLIQKGVEPTKVERMRRQKNSILEQEVKTTAAQRALLGNSGIDIIDDYRGVAVLSSYGPLQVEGSDWAILAEMDAEEAFAPITELQKQVLISTAILILLITVLALFLSRLFVKPIQSLMAGFHRLGEGETDVTVTVNSQDEFYDLAVCFNQMVANLSQKAQLLENQSQENAQLLSCILPDPVAQRLKSGEEQIADSYANVTVLFADLIGFTDLSEVLPANEIVALLNELVRAFDEAAERYGVEKIKTIGSGYMAVCGLSVPRLDHTKRIMDFGIEITRLVQRFNQTHQTALHARVGINSGSVVAGIVGRSKFIYDLWGDTVNIAHRMQTAGEGDTVQVSQSVYDQLGDIYEFDNGREVEISDEHKLPAWLLKI